MANEEQQERRRDSHPWGSLLAQALITLCGKPANIAAKWIPLAFIVASLAQPVSDAVVALAAHDTKADFRVSALVDIKANSENNYAVAPNEPDTQGAYVAVGGIVIGIGGFLMAFRQRRLRLDVIEKMSKRIRVLEHMIDPNRSTSGLTVRGETNPEDL